MRRKQFGAAGHMGLLIEAPMALGKTTAMRRWLEVYLRGHPAASGLLVTSRIQQSQTAVDVVRGLNFKHYRDVSGRLSGVSRLIVQYESLHRLEMDGNVPPFDIVLVDEIRSVAAQAVAPTNKQFLQRNKQLFVELSKAAKRVLFMDADVSIDPAVPTLCKDIWASHPNSLVHVRYTAVPEGMERRVAYYGEVTWQTMAVNALASGETVMAVFRSKAAMKIFLRLVNERVPDLPYKAYSRDSSASSMTDWSRIDDVLREGGIRLLCFTSKVTVGADIQYQFDRVIVNTKGTDGRTCSARTLLQMAGRARRVRDPVFP
jgi:hypothetical protein